MGIPLPKPVLTELRERSGNAIFRCGSSCVNGYRENMEDAHLVYLKPTWGFFGVFDGHVTDQCSMFLEEAWRAELEKQKIPISDDELRDTALKIDKEWVDSGREGGSTGTFFYALKDGATVHLQVGNVGDSRVIASINGACHALTEDHKPMNADERQRIEECGGRVENNRVDGCLAVSRAFGDRDYKQGSGGQLKQKVIALPTVTHADVKFNANDFVALCCDGVFEGTFSNEEVIQFIQEQLKTSNDLPVIAGKVCTEAIERGSRDNISCVIVQFTDGADYSSGAHQQVVVGPFSAPYSGSFRKAYEGMAVKANMTVGALLAQRYDYLKELTKKSAEEEEEFAFFENGPPPDASGDSRLQWFSTQFQNAHSVPNNQLEHLQRIQFLQQQVGVPLPVLLSILSEPNGQ